MGLVRAVEATRAKEFGVVSRERRSLQASHLTPDQPLQMAYKSFTCIPDSTTKNSGLNAPTTAVQPFIGFVEPGFPFTHNGGAAPTRQAATGHNALFAQQIHFEVDLFAWPIVRM
ncbi:hypothetical protein NE237_008265 [Protea cynaroides]|uniref:Uncharacterized protein n=1 Tax=Protea cynaroides TaxID=273540 RepID=A0A9Q0JR72_9MAGN|nr:hypothetical protein NE237_008265 [Protea cynaroides]